MTPNRIQPRNVSPRSQAATVSKAQPRSRVPAKEAAPPVKGSSAERSGPPRRVRINWINKVSTLSEEWSSPAGRILLGVVLAWFGYHELMAPLVWTGYIPVLSTTSHLAEVLVLIHGWVLLVCAVALVCGVVPRMAAGLASLLLLEIVISLTVSGGLSDLVLRDVGVLGLSIALIGAKGRRLVLTR